MAGGRRQRRRHRRSLRALAEAHDISALFPRVRPRDEVVEAFAQRVALELDPGDRSRDDAILVSAAAAKRSPQPFFDAAEELAGEHAEEWHVRRVQALAERLGAQLPIAGLPRASRTLGEGCRRVVADETAAHGVAAVLLATYALAGH